VASGDRVTLDAETLWCSETQWTRPSVQSFVRHARPATLPSAYWTLPWNVGSAAAPEAAR